MLIALGMTALEAATWRPAINTQVQPRYLSYFASFALKGNTNSLGSTDWPVVGRGGAEFSNVMKMNATKPDLFQTKVDWMLVDDDQNSEERCSFWNGIAQSVMDLMGPNVEKEADVDVSEDVEEEL